MKTLRINTAEKTDYSWNNKYTIFSESVGLLQKLISIPSFSGDLFQKMEAAIGDFAPVGQHDLHDLAEG